MMRCLVICCALFALGRSLDISRLQTGSPRAAPIQHEVTVTEVSPRHVAAGLPEAVEVVEARLQNGSLRAAPPPVTLEVVAAPKNAAAGAAAEAAAPSKKPSRKERTTARIKRQKAVFDLMKSGQRPPVYLNIGPLENMWENVPDLTQRGEREVVVLDVQNVGYPDGDMNLERWDTFVQRISMALDYYGVIEYDDGYGGIRARAPKPKSVVLVLGAGFLAQGGYAATYAMRLKWISDMETKLQKSGIGIVHTAQHKKRPNPPPVGYKDDDDDRDALEYAAVYDCEIVSNDFYRDFVRGDKRIAGSELSPAAFKWLRAQPAETAPARRLVAGERVLVGGKAAVVIRDMRPKFNTATVVWSDTNESYEANADSIQSQENGEKHVYFDEEWLLTTDAAGLTHQFETLTRLQRVAFLRSKPGRYKEPRRE